MVEKFNVFNFGLCPQSYFTYYSSLTGGRGSLCVEKENIVKISNDNNKEVFIGNNKNQDKKNSNDSKHKYIKVLVNDPFNNRDIILKVTKKQKGVYV